ncbi:unnamed protein product [Heterobilharzia americana]|nr:unnamed protein product [Heterobilharzia americana]
MIYTPLSIFTTDICKAVIYLNHPQMIPIKLFKQLWQKAYPIAFVDGFANHIYNNNIHDLRDNYLPNFLTGDFDSIEKEVLKFYYSKMNVSVIETLDQNETDFTKCLRVIINYIEENNINIDMITAVQMSGGRFDHEMASIKTLYETRKLTSIPLILITECCVIFLLDEGEHTIYANTGYEAEHIGLIPVGQSCQVTTKGLQWDLDNLTLSFHGIVSTSNRRISEIIQVKCDQPLIFTMEYNSEKIICLE